MLPCDTWLHRADGAAEETLRRGPRAVATRSHMRRTGCPQDTSRALTLVSVVTTFDSIPVEYWSLINRTDALGVEMEARSPSRYSDTRVAARNASLIVQDSPINAWVKTVFATSVEKSHLAAIHTAPSGSDVALPPVYRCPEPRNAAP